MEAYWSHRRYATECFIETFESVARPLTRRIAALSLAERVAVLLRPILNNSFESTLPFMHEAYAAYSLLDRQPSYGKDLHPDTKEIIALALGTLFLHYPTDSLYELHMKERGLHFAENLLRYLSATGVFEDWPTYSRNARQRAVKQLAHIQSTSYSDEDFSFEPPHCINVRHDLKCSGEHYRGEVGISSKIMYSRDDFAEVLLTLGHEDVHSFQYQLRCAFNNGLRRSCPLYGQAKLFAALQTNGEDTIYISYNKHRRAYENHPMERDARACESYIRPVLRALRTGTENRTLADFHMKRAALKLRRRAEELRTPALL